MVDHAGAGSGGRSMVLSDKQILLQTSFTALLYAAFLGQADVVRLLLARKGIEVNKSAADGATARCIASQNGHVEVVRLLLARQGVEVNMSRLLIDNLETRRRGTGQEAR
jgi:hypothetical protein